GARDPGPAGPTPDQRRNRRTAGHQPENRAQPGLQYPQQAASGGPGPGHHQGPRRRAGRITSRKFRTPAGEEVGPLNPNAPLAGVSVNFLQLDKEQDTDW